MLTGFRGFRQLWMRRVTESHIEGGGGTANRLGVHLVLGIG